MAFLTLVYPTTLGISRKKAKEYIDTYFERYPGIKAYMDNVVREAKDKGYRRDPLPPPS